MLVVPHVEHDGGTSTSSLKDAVAEVLRASCLTARRRAASETSSENNYRREECVHAFPWITELNDREGVAAVARTDNSSATELGGSAMDLR